VSRNLTAAARLAPLAVAAAVGAAGCTVGAPPGFSGGEQWVFPLVGPLEDGLLLTPVSINGHGPYLFAFDPDANITAIDKQVVEQAQLRIGSGPHRIDESDTGQVRVYAEMIDLRIAGLTIDRRDAMVFPIGLYDSEGRHINGILGRDVVADSLVFGFDRDHGVATLSTTRAFRPPPGAHAIRYESVSTRSPFLVSNVTPERAAGRSGAALPDVVPVPRRVATAQVGEATFGMHLDLGAVTSQLREASWGSAKLAPASIQLRLVDESATAREVTRAAIGDVRAGEVRSARVTFVPYVDQRFLAHGLDGALGLDFFAPYSVYADWNETTFYLRPRDTAARTAARLGRWGSDLPACPHPGCITTELIATDATAVLKVTRDVESTGHALEVTLGVVPAPGRAVSALAVELPSSVSSLSSTLSGEYVGAALTVLDVSPFPRMCPNDGGCVVEFGAPALRSEPASASPPARSVALESLRRLTGEPEISPSAEVLAAANGKPVGAAIVRVCLNAEGKVESTRIVKSSGVAAYDEQVQGTLRATWTFAPPPAGSIGQDARASGVCTLVTFVPR